MNRNSFCLSIILFLPLLFAGCSQGDDPTFDTVMHLDPRLEDGRSSVSVLAGSRQVLHKQRFGGKKGGLGPWKIENAELRNVKAKGGLSLKRSKDSDSAKDCISIVYPASLPAKEVNAVEVDLLIKQGRKAHLEWRLKNDKPKKIYSLEVMVIGSDRFQTLEFYLGKYPDWRGQIEGLHIKPEWDSPAHMRIREVRLLKKGFSFGYEPLGGESGDGGLIEIQSEARRVWPADQNVPLFSSFQVPRNALFRATVAALSSKEMSERLRFVLDARIPGADWERIHTEPVDSAQGWTPFRVSLSRYTGQTVDLRFLILPEDREGKISSTPMRARGLWGEPAVLGITGRTRKPSVLVVTLDTTRADHVGDERRTPCMAQLGKQGIVFTNAWSTCNSTAPSHASILTGLHVVEHGATHNRAVLPDRIVTLAERFRKAGYDTAAAVSVRHLQAGVGFGQGFDRFRQADDKSPTNGMSTVEPVLKWMEEWRLEGERPFFLWVHVFDPHIPYGPPGEFGGDFANRMNIEIPAPKVEPATRPVFDRDNPRTLEWLKGITNHEHVMFLYGAGVFYADHLVGLLLDGLEEGPGYDECAVVITADHGESLSEHDIWYDHSGLFRQSTAVPLLLRVPDGPSGLRIDTPASTLDIATTLINLCGLEGGTQKRGEDLLAMARKRGYPKRRVWFEYAHLRQIGTYDGRYYFISTVGDSMRYGHKIDYDEDGKRIPKRTEVPRGTCLLYDMEKDPELLSNLVEEMPERAEQYRKLVELWRQTRNAGEVINRQLTPEEEEQLRALGYGAGD